MPWPLVREGWMVSGLSRWMVSGLSLGEGGVRWPLAGSSLDGLLLWLLHTAIATTRQQKTLLTGETWANYIKLYKPVNWQPKTHLTGESLAKSLRLYIYI